MGETSRGAYAAKPMDMAMGVPTSKLQDSPLNAPHAVPRAVDEEEEKVQPDAGNNPSDTEHVPRVV